MIRTATRADLVPLQLLLRDANDAPYDIGAVAEEKLFGRGVSGEPVVRVYDDGRIRGLAVRCGKYLRLLAVDRASRRDGIGTALLRDAGATVIGAEPGNYFTPGVWDQDQGTTSFLRARGYRERSITWNLYAETAGAVAESTVGGTAPPSMLEFVEREFGTAWRFELERGYAVWIEEVGFAAYEANNRGLGTFGPTGVAKSMRGRGYGGRLARSALARLRELGYERAIIPWTDAVDYYARWCGARPAHRFAAFAVDSRP